MSIPGNEFPGYYQSVATRRKQKGDHTALFFCNLDRWMGEVVGYGMIFKAPCEKALSGHKEIQGDLLLTFDSDPHSILCTHANVGGR